MIGIAFEMPEVLEPGGARWQKVSALLLRMSQAGFDAMLAFAAFRDPSPFIICFICLVEQLLHLLTTFSNYHSCACIIASWSRAVPSSLMNRAFLFGAFLQLLIIRRKERFKLHAVNSVVI